MPTYIDLLPRRGVASAPRCGDTHAAPHAAAVPTMAASPRDARARSDVRALLESDDLDDRLTAVVVPEVGVEWLARAIDGVVGDPRPVAGLIRSVAAAKLRVAWRHAESPVAHVRIARAAAGRVALPMPVEVLRRALGWSWPVRATIGRFLAENPDPIAAMVGERWRDRSPGE